jgi:hypothetical protein
VTNVTSPEPGAAASIPPHEPVGKALTIAGRVDGSVPVVAGLVVTAVEVDAPTAVAGLTVVLVVDVSLELPVPPPPHAAIVTVASTAAAMDRMVRGLTVGNLAVSQ